MKTKQYSINQAEMNHPKKFQYSGNDCRSMRKSRNVNAQEQKSIKWFIDEIILAAVIAGGTIISIATLFECIIKPFFTR